MSSELSSQIPKDVRVDPAIQQYLDSSNSDVRHLPPLEAKVHQLSIEQKEEMNQLKKAETHIRKPFRDQTNRAHRLIRLSEAKVTKMEAKQFQQSLAVKTSQQDIYKPGPLMQRLIVPKKTDLDVDDLLLLIDVASDFASQRDEHLPNGRELFGGEKCALFMYTSDTYLLLNGTIHNDPTSLAQWLEEGMGWKDPTTEEAQKFLKKCQEEVPQIVEMALSGLHKLPSYEGTLYRGDAMPKEQIEEWKKGKILMTGKVFSCSTQENTCEDFAKKSAVSYMKDTHKEYQPVLYVIEAKNAKSISKYSFNPDEDEYVYPPGQLLRSVAVDEETVPGLAIIYLQEKK